MTAAANATTINAAEVEKFSRMAAQWWDAGGKFKPIHKLNPARIGYIREQAMSHFALDGAQRFLFEGLRVLDIGCGGGVLSEPMARLGATVVGADAAADNIAVARVHAQQAGLDIDYRATTAEALAAAGEQFDIVLNMEVVEHVDNVPLYMRSCAQLVKPGGMTVVATLNRTARAMLFGVFAAEYVLGWLPRGTHDWRRFLTPEEIGALLTRNGLQISGQTGLVYHPIEDAFKPSADMGINYMIAASKPKLLGGRHA